MSSPLCPWAWQLWVLGSLAWQPQAVAAAHKANGVPLCSLLCVTQDQEVIKPKNLTELILTIFLLPLTSIHDPEQTHTHTHALRHMSAPHTHTHTLTLMSAPHTLGGPHTHKGFSFLSRCHGCDFFPVHLNNPA